MTRFVAVSNNIKSSGISEKYVKQTYEALSNNNINLENIAIQISQLPIREQNKFLRLMINYIEMTANKKNMHYAPVGLSQAIELCDRIMGVVNDYYEEQDKLIGEM